MSYTINFNDCDYIVVFYIILLCYVAIVMMYQQRSTNLQWTRPTKFMMDIWSTGVGVQEKTLKAIFIMEYQRWLCGPVLWMTGQYIIYMMVASHI